jgi:hypothetical protein
MPFVRFGALIAETKPHREEHSVQHEFPAVVKRAVGEATFAPAGHVGASRRTRHVYDHRRA